MKVCNMPIQKYYPSHLYFSELPERWITCHLKKGYEFGFKYLSYKNIGQNRLKLDSTLMFVGWKQFSSKGYSKDIWNIDIRSSNDSHIPIGSIWKHFVFHSSWISEGRSKLSFNMLLPCLAMIKIQGKSQRYFKQKTQTLTAFLMKVWMLIFNLHPMADIDKKCCKSLLYRFKPRAYFCNFVVSSCWSSGVVFFV